MIVINCMRYLDITDFNVIDRMTILEFELRMRAYQLKQLDKERDMYAQAWIHRQSKATKKSGKPFYKNFRQFFNIEQFRKDEREILCQGDLEQQDPEKHRLLDALRRAGKIYGKL